MKIQKKKKKKKKSGELTKKKYRGVFNLNYLSLLEIVQIEAEEGPEIFR